MDVGAVIHKLIDVFVPGSPKTKGSMAHRGGGQMVESVKGSKTWRLLMAHALRQRWNAGEGDSVARGYEPREPRVGQIRVSATFFLPCARGSRSLITKGSGDVDKLARNLLDALTDSGVIVDDAQVVGLIVDKREASDASGSHGHGRALEPQGVRIVVWEGP